MLALGVCSLTTCPGRGGIVIPAFPSLAYLKHHPGELEGLGILARGYHTRDFNAVGGLSVIAPNPLRQGVPWIILQRLADTVVSQPPCP